MPRRSRTSSSTGRRTPSATWRRRSSGAASIRATDKALLELFPDDERLQNWLTYAADQIAEARREKESAIDAQDFEKAAKLRDKEKQLVAKRAEREKQWRSGDLDVVAEVDVGLEVRETVLADLASAEPARRGEAR